jgi:hypothetical protein
MPFTEGVVFIARYGNNFIVFDLYGQSANGFAKVASAVMGGNGHLVVLILIKNEVNILK